MNTFWSILIAIVIFCVIVLVHEFGHYFVAKLCGIRVDEFSIGMGPVIYKKMGKETLFTVRALPIGGACMMGEDVDEERSDSFRKKPVPQKMAVIVAGAFMNIVLGFVIAVAALIISGKAVTSTIVYFSDDAVSRRYV